MFRFNLFLTRLSLSQTPHHSPHPSAHSCYPCAPPSTSCLVPSSVSLTALNDPCPIRTTSSTSRFLGMAWVMNIIVTLPLNWLMVAAKCSAVTLSKLLVASSKNQYLGLLEQCPCNRRQALLLSAGESHAAFADFGLVAFVKASMVLWISAILQACTT
jgi:hypothetical protein